MCMYTKADVKHGRLESSATASEHGRTNVNWTGRNQEIIDIKRESFLEADRSRSHLRES